MTVEEFAEIRYGRRLGDKWDKESKQFDYYDLIDFAESYHEHQLEEQEQKRKSDPMKRII